MSTFAENVKQWKDLQREARLRRKCEREAKLLAELRAAADRTAIDEYPKLAKEAPKLRAEVSSLKGNLATRNIVSKISLHRIKQLDRKVERRRRARAEARAVYLSPSMVAHRVWERTGRCDWAAVIRMGGLDGTDVMDFTAADASTVGNSIAVLVDPEGFCEAMLALRDELTRPVTELLYRLRDAGDPESDWFEAQRLLKALFAQGLDDPSEARLEAAKAVVTRFRPIALETRYRSVLDALENALE
jgi:hypothetical protein